MVLIRSRLIAGALLMLALCLAVPLARTAVAAESGPAQPAGLMWNRTGLPAVFPLQVKTPPGRDYFLTLTDVGGDTPSLAAFIEGGDFFKVLVPPGTFRVAFAAGDEWQGEEDLFGPGAQTWRFELPDPLTFQTRGYDTKAGHLVDLVGVLPGKIAEAKVKDQLICQSVRLDFPTSIYDGFELGRAWEVDPPEDVRAHGRRVTGRPLGFFEKLRYPEDLPPYSEMQGYDVQSQYCD
ncbi:hypothetical protein ACEWPL_001085 [Roseovarius sp. S1116L3]|uniref:hypothetical protein n=1 Tax=Roseovarius roseus TaxID=3342636 RepID=UPI003728F759